MRRPRGVYQTPESSSRSHPRGHNANALQNNGNTLETPNPFALLSRLETSSMLGAEDGGLQYQQQPLTPTSQQPNQFSDAGGMEASPSFERGMNMPYHFQGQAIHAQPTPTVNVHGWGQGELAPSQAIDTWNEATYSIANPTATSLQPPNSSRGGRRPSSSRRSGHSSGHLSCSHQGCGMRFDNNSDLTHHARNHGPRSKRCTMCPKRFLYDKDLNRHIRTHTKEKKYFCPYEGCKYYDQGFSRKDHKDRHVRGVHKQEEAA